MTLSKYPTENVTAGPYQPRIDSETVDIFVCGTSNTTQSRLKQGLTTYRYDYSGNFSSLTPLWWMGAYHASDVPMVFGTYDRYGGPGSKTFFSNAEENPVTEFQRTVAEAMQDYVLAFLRDPENGLRRKGWLPYGDPAGAGGGKNMLRFAAGETLAKNVSAAELDDACVLGLKYNSRPL